MVSETPKAKPAPERITMRMLRAYWPEEDVRVNVGETYDLPTAVAKNLVKLGIAEVADPFGGK